VNNELQLGKSDQDKPRKSIIRKSIQRTLTTAKFENIVIHDEIEEEIEWSSLKERQSKIDNWNTILIQNLLRQTHDKVMEELNLAQKKAYFKNNLEDKDYRPKPGATHELDELLNLDALGQSH